MHLKTNDFLHITVRTTIGQKNKLYHYNSFILNLYNNYYKLYIQLYEVINYSCVIKLITFPEER